MIKTEARYLKYATESIEKARQLWSMGNHDRAIYQARLALSDLRDFIAILQDGGEDAE